MNGASTAIDCKMKTEFYRNYKFIFPENLLMGSYSADGSTIITISDENSDKAKIIIRNGMVKVENYYGIPLIVERCGSVLYESV